MTSYEQGQTAHRKGERADHCPYLEPRFRWAWLEGWYRAEHELRSSSAKLDADTSV